MTATQQIYLDRLRAIRAPKRANMGYAKKPAAAPDAGAPVPITADQGPLPDGGNLGQQPMPNMQSGIVPGRNRMSIGNSARGNIDLGSFLSARPNQDAINQLSQNPLAQVDPYKATTGVGGFFRRLLGDDANERNEMAAGQRGQMLAQKWLIDQQNQGRMSAIDKQHQYEMERLKAASDFNNSETQYKTQLGLQGKQLENSWALQQAQEQAKQARTNRFDDLTSAVGDPILASQLQQRMITSPLDKMDADTQEALARAQGTGGFAPRPQTERNSDVIPSGGMRLGDKIYLPDENGKLQLFTGELGSGGFDPVAASPRSRELTAAKAAQNEIEKLQQPGTVLGGIGTVASDIGGAIGGAVGKAAPFVPGLSGLSALGGEKDRLFNYLRRIEEQKKARELMKRGLVNPIPTTE